MTTLPGVAIAVALMPPLCTLGFGLGSGVNTTIMAGAGLLFLTNLVAIVASAFAVFLLVGMNSPDVRAQMENSREGEVLARRFATGPLARVLANSGKLRWRILTLAVLLATIAIPLRKAFVQVADEAVVRGAVQDVVKDLLPQGSIVSQQVEVDHNDVSIRLISTQDVSAAKQDAAAREIERRSGRKVDLSVATIASQNELAALMQRLSAPPPPAPKPVVKSLDEIHQQLMQRIRPVVEGVWPPEAPLEDFDVDFDANGIVLNARYTSAHDLEKLAQNMILRQLQEKLGTENIALVAQRVAPARSGVKEASRMAKH